MSSTERDVVLEERRMRVDNNPQALASEQISAALHLSHPYGRPVIGWANEVRRIDTMSARDFYKHHYAPNNAILIIAGDVTARSGAACWRSPNMARWRRANCSRAPNSPSRRAWPKPAWTLSRPDVEGAGVPARLSRAVLCPGRAGPGGRRWKCWPRSLGGDQTAALYRMLVEEKKLATEAGASYDGYARDASEFTVYAVPRPGVCAGNAGTGGRSGAGRRSPPRRRKRRPHPRQDPIGGGGVTYRRDSQFAMASAYGTALMIGLTADDVNEWPNRIRAVAAEDVRKAGGSSGAQGSGHRLSEAGSGK